MSLGQIFTIKIVANDFGPTANLLALNCSQSCQPSQEDAKNKVKHTTPPWCEYIQNPETLNAAYIDWRYRITDELIGHHDQFGEAINWAKSGPDGPALRFITGNGGVGKSRLAAEVAERLGGEEGWETYFIGFSGPSIHALGTEGTLLVIDYPEENLAVIEVFLRSLSDLQAKETGRLRILMLSRREQGKWENLLEECKFRAAHPKAIHLDILSEEAAYKLFKAVQKKTGETSKKKKIPEISKEDFGKWLSLSRSENQRALFVLSAAVFSVFHPDAALPGYSGVDIVKTIAVKEFARLKLLAKEQKLKDRLVFPRLVAIATLANRLSIQRIMELIDRKELYLEMSSAEVGIEGKLNASGLLREGVLEPMKPDIIGAVFVLNTLNESRASAPELMWAGLELDVESGLERLGRLCHDIEYTLGVHGQKLGEWLKEAVDGKPERCNQLRSSLEEVSLPLGLLETAVCVWRTLLSQAKNDEEKAYLFTFLSIHESGLGQTETALEAIQEAVEHYRKLAEANPARFLPDLASSLNNLSLRLSDVGDTEGALNAIQEAVEHYRKLAEANPARFLPDLATSLNNLSLRLSDVGDTEGALNAIQEAVEHYRKLAEANPARFLPNLAMSLNNLSSCLTDVGDTEGALTAIQEAVEHYRKLAEANPARFLPDLSRSHGPLGIALRQQGKMEDALEAFESGAATIKPFAEKYPGSPHNRLYQQFLREIERTKEMMG